MDGRTCNIRVCANSMELQDSLAAAHVRHLATWPPTLASSVASHPRRNYVLQGLAQQHHVTESILLKRLVDVALLQKHGRYDLQIARPIEPISRDSRVYVRLRPEDHVLLRERASGRGMATATYASILLRAHLRAVSPLPERELGELKRSVAELGADRVVT